MSVFLPVLRRAEKFLLIRNKSYRKTYQDSHLRILIQGLGLR